MLARGPTVVYHVAAHTATMSRTICIFVGVAAAALSRQPDEEVCHMWRPYPNNFVKYSMVDPQRSYK